MTLQIAAYNAFNQVEILKNGTSYIIPDDSENTLRKELNAWLAAGNSIEPYIPPAILSKDVNRERDRRITSGFEFEGKMYDYDSASKQRITGAATMAGFAMAQGASAGNYRWHGGDQDFGWIAKDNSITLMDAVKVYDFGLKAARWESDHIFAAKALKQSSPIASDYKDNAYWPS